MKKCVFWLMTAILIAFIWGNSLQDATHSSMESRWVLDLVQSTLPVIPGISHVTMYEIRKASACDGVHGSWIFSLVGAQRTE